MCGPRSPWRPCGDAKDPGDSELLSALVSSRESEEAGVDGLYAKVTHDAQRDAEERDAVAS